MKLIKQYSTKIEEHIHMSLEKFFGFNQTTIFPIYGLSPQDPEKPICLYFNVGYKIEIKNSNNEIVFILQTLTTFLIENKNEEPTVDFLLPLAKNGFLEFINIYNAKILKTNLHHHKLSITSLDIKRKDLAHCIDFWNKNIRNTSLS